MSKTANRPCRPVSNPTKMWLVFLLEGSEEKGTRQVISVSGSCEEEQKLISH